MVDAHDGEGLVAGDLPGAVAREAEGEGRGGGEGGEHVAGGDGGQRELLRPARRGVLARDPHAQAAPAGKLAVAFHLCVWLEGWMGVDVVTIRSRPTRQMSERPRTRDKSVA